MNPLYLQAKKFATDTTSAQLKCTLTGSKYFLHEFAKTKFAFEFNRTQLTLLGHHLSIHEQDDPENHYLSAYHYTAYFGSQAARYQLHTYFDRKDEVLAIQFSQVIGDSKSAIALSDESKQILIDQAIKMTYSFVRPLRAKVQAQLTSDKKNIGLLIGRISNAHSPRQYQKTILQIIHCLTDLCSYDKHSAYAYQLKYYKRMLRQVPPSLTTSATSSFKERKHASAYPDVLTDSDTDELILLESPLKQRNSPTKYREPLTPTIERLMQEFSQYKSMATNANDIELLLPRILKLYQESCIADLSRDEKEYNVTSEDEYNLDTLLHNIEKQRLELFQRLTMFKKYDSALQLMNDEQIDEYELSRLVYLSLNTTNHELLDFLLTHYEYPINTSEFNSLSPAMYCLKRSETVPAVSRCFEVLLKHKASLAEQVPGTSMSIAETILLTPDHPLKQTQRFSVEERKGAPSCRQRIETRRCFGTMENFFQKIEKEYDDAMKIVNSTSDGAQDMEIARRAQMIRDRLNECRAALDARFLGLTK